MSVPMENGENGGVHFHAVSYHMGTPRNEKMSKPYEYRPDAAEAASREVERYEGVFAYIARHEPVVKISG